MPFCGLCKSNSGLYSPRRNYCYKFSHLKAANQFHKESRTKMKLRVSEAQTTSLRLKSNKTKWSKCSKNQCSNRSCPNWKAAIHLLLNLKESDHWWKKLLPISRSMTPKRIYWKSWIPNKGLNNWKKCTMKFDIFL